MRIQYSELEDNFERFVKGKYIALRVRLPKASQTIFYRKEDGNKITAVLLFTGVLEMLVKELFGNLKEDGVELKTFHYESKWLKGQKDYYVDCERDGRECMKLARLLFLEYPNKDSEIKRSDPDLVLKFYRMPRWMRKQSDE